MNKRVTVPLWAIVLFAATIGAMVFGPTLTVHVFHSPDGAVRCVSSFHGLLCASSTAVDWWVVDPQIVRSQTRLAAARLGVGDSVGTEAGRE
jgi:hypothetical protein